MNQMEAKQKNVTMLMKAGVSALFCATAVLLSESAAVGQEAVVSQEVKALEMSSKEDVLRQEAYERARGYFDSARSNFDLNGDFEYAKEKYEQALAELNKAKGSSSEAGAFSKQVLDLQDEVEKNIMKLNIRWAHRLIDEAIREANEDKTEEAEEKLNEAEKYPKITTVDKDRIAKLKKQMELKKAEIRFADETKVSEIIQDKAEDDLQVRIMLEKGRVLLQNCRFGDARDMFE